jgi:23S rRNA (pseudouridine1915-N3)-methyltransferase
VKITIVAVGKVREKFIKEGIKEYTKRLTRFCNIEIIEVQDEQVPNNISIVQEELIKRKEGERILKRIRSSSILIALDMKGTKLNSEAFAEKLDQYTISGNPHITFIIGGSIGLDDEIIRMANLQLSLSDMTFPHQLVRVILLEQIYRSFKIIKGETYHK